MSFGIVTEKRNKAFFSSYPISLRELAFVTRKHEYFHTGYVFIHPFPLEMWVLTLASLFITPALLYSILSKKYSPQDLFMPTLKSFAGQGMSLQPKNLKVYLLLVFWFIGITFVIYIYSAVLLSSITIPSKRGKRTIKDLAKGIKNDKYPVS